MPGKHVHFADDLLETPSPAYSSSSLPSEGPLTPSTYTTPLVSIPSSPSKLANMNIVHIHPALSRMVEYTAQIDLTLSPQPQYKLLHPHRLGEAATSPPLPFMRITCPHLPWGITITPTGVSKQGPFITVKDVFDQLYTNLRTAVSEKEYKEIRTPAEERAIAASYHQRYQKISDLQAREVERSKGVKRIDFLKGMNGFRGLSLANANVSEQWLLHVS